MRTASGRILGLLLIVTGLPLGQGQTPAFDDLRDLDAWYWDGAWRERFAAYVRRASDLNDDGYADLLVHYSGGWRCGGCPPVVEILSGWDGRPLWRYRYEGWELALTSTAGQADFADVDGDGEMEIILGMEGVPSPIGSGIGMVEARSLDGSRTFWTRYADDEIYYFGVSLSRAGDVNGDGHEDVIVHAVDYNLPSGLNAGVVTVLSGQDGSSLYTYFGNRSEAYGDAIHRGVGDVNGDGFSDFAIGSRRRVPPGVPDAHGMVWIFSGATGKVIWEIKPEPGDWIGTKFVAPGDVDADGHPDFIIGGIYDLFTFSGADGSLLWRWHSPDPDENYLNMSEIPDVSDDGVTDIIIARANHRFDPGEPLGSISLLSGRTGELLSDTRSPGPVKKRFALAVQGTGDLTGDGWPDLVEWESSGSGYFAWIMAHTSLKAIPSKGTSGGADLFLDVPSSPGRPYALFFALGSEGRVPLGSRWLPLDPDPLFLWSLSHPVWGVLDGAGKARIQLGSVSPPGGTTSGEFSSAGVVFAPGAPLGIQTVTNHAVIPLK